MATFVAGLWQNRLLLFRPQQNLIRKVLVFPRSFNFQKVPELGSGGPKTWRKHVLAALLGACAVVVRRHAWRCKHDSFDESYLIFKISKILGLRSRDLATVKF